MLIGACIQSPDEKLHKVGEDKFNNLKAEYDPAKVIL
jgi:hypothetical protein